MVGMKAAGIKSRSSWGRMLVSDAFSAAIMASLVNGLKYSVWEMRPDRSGRNSFPSGHTATAFMTATMFSREYGERSVWYSVGAYSVAATIGLMRIFNDKHWLGDVLAGAGIGILSTEMGYWLADLIFKDKGIRHFPVDGEFSSSYCPSFMGLYLGMNVVLGNRMPDSRRGFSPGSVAGVEGVWFFGPYMGVGSRLTVSGTFFPGQEIAGPVRMNMTSACAGMYFFVSCLPEAFGRRQGHGRLCPFRLSRTVRVGCRSGQFPRRGYFQRRHGDFHLFPDAAPSCCPSFCRL